MPDTKTLTDPRRKKRERLIGLAMWAAGEHAKRELGLRSEWDQGSWLNGDPSCGTTCCIAGKVALEDGAIPLVLVDGEQVASRRAARKLWTSGATETDNGKDVEFDLETVCVPGSTEAIDIETYARQALGLTLDQADELFAADNDLESVLSVIARLIDDLA